MRNRVVEVVLAIWDPRSLINLRMRDLCLACSQTRLVWIGIGSVWLSWFLGEISPFSRGGSSTIILLLFDQVAVITFWMLVGQFENELELFGSRFQFSPLSCVVACLFFRVAQFLILMLGCYILVTSGTGREFNGNLDSIWKKFDRILSHFETVCADFQLHYWPFLANGWRICVNSTVRLRLVRLWWGLVLHMAP